ncbi:MAG: sugar ABC transporter substrate-binding protein [Planctomycetes bacterium]|nr:sugar ABC transporter substrate-binding protein [Planctomycetota bacterium]
MSRIRMVVGLAVAVAMLGATFAASAFAGEKKEFTIANIRWDMGDIAFNGDQHGTELEIKDIEARDGVKINMLTFGSNDPQEQRKAAEAYFARGVDGILLSAFQPSAVIPIVREANRRGIPIVTHDSAVPGQKQITVYPLAVSAGEILGNAMLKNVEEIRGEEYLKNEGGHIVELRGIVTMGVDIQRYTGWRNALEPFLAKYPKVTVSTHVAEFNANKARQAADANLSRYGDKVLCFFSIDGTMGVAGAIPALKSAGLFKPRTDPKHIPVGTIDGTEEEFEAARRGDLNFFIDNGKITQGRLAMRTLYEWMTLGFDALAKPGDELWPKDEDIREPYEVVDGKTQEPEFEGYIYSFRNLCYPLDMDGKSKDGWGNAYYHAINGKWPWE